MNPLAMPLNESIAEATSILNGSPDAAEILVERVSPLRFDGRSGGFEQLFANLN